MDLDFDFSKHKQRLESATFNTNLISSWVVSCVEVEQNIKTSKKRITPKSTYFQSVVLIDMLYKVQYETFLKFVYILIYKVHKFVNHNIADLEIVFENINCLKDFMTIGEYQAYSLEFNTLSRRYHHINYRICGMINHLRKNVDQFDDYDVDGLNFTLSSEYILEKQMEEPVTQVKKRKREFQILQEENFLDPQIASMCLYSNDSICLRNRSVKKKVKS